MNTNDFIDWQDQDNLLRYRFVTERGEVVDFMVQYETFIDGTRYRIVRYDGSHGQGHRDILNARGETVDKHWLPGHMSLADCLTYASMELRNNWQAYRDRFLEQFHEQ